MPYCLDNNQTFESQKEIVIKTIVPSLMKTLDLDTYPIGEGVVYEMLHQRHRHKRNDLRNKSKPEGEKYHSKAIEHHHRLQYGCGIPYWLAVHSYL